MRWIHSSLPHYLGCLSELRYLLVLLWVWNWYVESRGAGERQMCWSRRALVCHVAEMLLEDGHAQRKPERHFVAPDRERLDRDWASSVPSLRAEGGKVFVVECLILTGGNRLEHMCACLWFIYSRKFWS